MNILRQCEAIRMLDRLGMKYEVVNEYVLKCEDRRMEIRTYDEDFDLSIYPEKFIRNKTATRRGMFFCVWCRDIKELENNILMLTKLL